MAAAVVLETSRLRLRGWTDDDIEPWIAMNADPRVMEYFPAPYDREKAIATAALLRAELDADGFGWWIVEQKGEPKFGGVIALQQVPFETHFTPAVEIGWRLPYGNWGKGFATEGAAAALEFGFNVLHLNEIIAMTAALNVRSQRVMERLGMVRDAEGDFEHPRLPEGHRLRRHVVYRLTRR